MFDWRPWFKTPTIPDKAFTLPVQEIQAEMMYQAFKARLIEELEVQSNFMDPGTRRLLVDTTKGGDDG